MSDLRDPQRVVIEFPIPRWSDGRTTRHNDWVQGVTEAALGGVRAWLAGAGLTTEPTVFLDPEVFDRGSAPCWELAPNGSGDRCGRIMGHPGKHASAEFSEWRGSDE